MKIWLIINPKDGRILTINESIQFSIAPKYMLNYFYNRNAARRCLRALKRNHERYKNYKIEKGFVEVWY